MIFCLLVIYGLHTINERLKLWEELGKMVSSTQDSLICKGDFNAVLTGEDKIYGKPVQEMEIKDFNDFMVDVGMTELKAIGRGYTGSNGCTCSKIDRAMVNAEWMLNMRQREICVMQPDTFDHSPLSMELDSTKEVNQEAIKFFNCMTNHHEFLHRVKDAWSGGQNRDLKEVWHTLKKVK